jgi:hypothetical protein
MLRTSSRCGGMTSLVVIVVIGRSPNKRLWLSGGHEAFIGPSISNQSIATPGPTCFFARPAT